MNSYSTFIDEFLSSSEALIYHPLVYLIEPALKTTIAHVYANPFVPAVIDPAKKLMIDIFGPSGVGKDTVTRLSE